jgi:hypothetical protein
VVDSGDYPKAVLALGHRARSLFLGFRQLVEGPSPVAAMSLVRPMVEINLLLRFLGQDPELHTELWIAEGQRQIAAFLDDYARDAFLQKRWGPAPMENEALKEQYRAGVRESRKKALDKGVPAVGKTGPVLPSVREIAKTSGDPGAREAYILAYRIMSADVHVGTWAFRGGAFIERQGGLASYSEPRDPTDFHGARTLVMTTFASTLCIVSVVLGLNIHERADEIKRAFVPAEAPIVERIERTV